MWGLIGRSSKIFVFGFRKTLISEIEINFLFGIFMIPFGVVF
jgi:hypothetical protein